MKQLLLLILIFAPVISLAQCDTNNVVQFPDVSAEFQGGTAEMLKFVQENMEYPPIRGHQCHEFIGRIYLKFIVCADGSIQNITGERLSGDDELDRNAINLVQKMPRWIPATVDGKAVSSFVRLPISIHLQ